MTATEEIFQHLQRLKNESQSVRLLNVYKGLPITNDCPIVEITREAITFEINKYQQVCLELQRRTFIQHKELPNVVRASIVRVDMIKETATLTAFIYLGADIGRRLLVRVQPKEQVQIEATLHGQTLRGELADVSVRGAGFRTGAFFYKQSFFSLHSSLVLTMQFPDTRAPLKLNAEIMNVKKDGDSFRLGVALQTDAQTQWVLSQYIARRQAEIMRELRRMYDMFYQMANKKE